MYPNYFLLDHDQIHYTYNQPIPISLSLIINVYTGVVECDRRRRRGFVYYLNSTRPDYSVWLINNAQRRCVSKDSQAEELCAQGQRMSYCCRVTMPRCPIVSIITYVKHANELCAAGERRSWFEESGGGGANDVPRS